MMKLLGDENVVYYDSGYMAVFVCQNLLNCTLKIDKFY